MTTSKYKMEEFTEDNVPIIRIDPEKMTRADLDLALMSKYDIFYRRIVEYTLSYIEDMPVGNILVVLIDDDGIEYEMCLPPEGFSKSLNKAMDYFKQIEEYETCDLIKQILKNI